MIDETCKASFRDAKFVEVIATTTFCILIAESIAILSWITTEWLTESREGHPEMNLQPAMTIGTIFGASMLVCMISAMFARKWVYFFGAITSLLLFVAWFLILAGLNTMIDAFAA